MKRLMVLTLLVCLVRASAQSPALTGVVTDPSGASIPGAAIQLRGPAGDKRVKTDSGGRYSFSNLAAGRYRLRVSANGFTTAQQDLVVTNGGGPVTHNTSLTIQSRREEITVDETSGVRTGSDPAANGSALVLRQRQLAVLSDDPDELAQQLEALAGPAPGPMGGQIYIDGFLGGQLPPKSSIREIRVNSNPFSAEYDKPGFGRVEIFTKPGSDTFRGEFLAQFNDRLLNSRNPLLTQGGNPPYRAEIFNLNLAGPIAKNRASWGLNIERRQISENALILATTLDSQISQAFATPATRTAVVPRLDYTLNSKNTLVLRYQDIRVEQDDQGVGGFNLPSRAYNENRSEHALQATETAMLSARMVNETRFQFLRSSIGETPDNTAPGVIVAGAFSGGGAAIGNSHSLANSWELSNLTSLSRGKHAFKWGGRLRYVGLADFSVANFSGTYTFYTLDQFRRLSPSQFSMNAGVAETTVSQADLGLFVNDDWRVRQNLTLSYGVRYEAQTNYGDLANWAPRIGLAWSPSRTAKGNPKTVVRLGAGAFYDRISVATALNALRYDGTTQQSYQILDPNFYPAIPSLAALQALHQPQQLQPVYNAIRAPRTYQASAGVERQIGRQSRITMTYIASRGVDLPNSRNINAPIGGIYPYGDRSIRLLTESAGTMRLNQLTINPAINLKRLTLFGFYLLSYGQDNNEGQPANPYNLRAEWGPASWGDVRHRMIVAMAAKLPWNFSASPFLMASSGQPYNITTGLDPNNTGFPAERPLQGASVLERNAGRGPAVASLGLRLSHTWSFGGERAASAPQSTGGGHDPTIGPWSSNSRKSLTLTASTLNALNHTNLAPPVGNLSSPYFGQSLGLADLMGHAGKPSTYNRKIDLQLRFTF